MKIKCFLRVILCLFLYIPSYSFATPSSGSNPASATAWDDWATLHRRSIQEGIDCNRYFWMIVDLTSDYNKCIDTFNNACGFLIAFSSTCDELEASCSALEDQIESLEKRYQEKCG